MCGKCRGLIDTPDGKKTRVVLFDKTRDCYDADYFFGFMEIEKKHDGTGSAFIKQDVKISSTGRCYGVAIPVKYCPFCGEKLYEETN